MAALTLAYLGMAVARLRSARDGDAVLVVAHLAALALLCVWAARADLEDFTPFYMRVWGLFFCEYLIVPAAVLCPADEGPAGRRTAARCRRGRRGRGAGCRAAPRRRGAARRRKLVRVRDRRLARHRRPPRTATRSTRGSSRSRCGRRRRLADRRGPGRHARRDHAAATRSATSAAELRAAGRPRRPGDARRHQPRPPQPRRRPRRPPDRRRRRPHGLAGPAHRVQLDEHRLLGEVAGVTVLHAARVPRRPRRRHPRLARRRLARRHPARAGARARPPTPRARRVAHAAGAAGRRAGASSRSPAGSRARPATRAPPRARGSWRRCSRSSPPRARCAPPAPTRSTTAPAAARS